MDKRLLAMLALLFLVTQTIGLGTGYFLQLYFAQQPEQKPVIVSQDPNDSANGIALIVWILFSTGLLLAALKFLKGNLLDALLKAFEALAIFGASWLVFSIVLGDPTGLFLAMALVFCKNIFSQSIMMRNIASVFATAGAGALIGTIIGIVPAIVFMALLSIYDYIAVFKTKHMVGMAKAITKKNLAFTYALPTKEHKFELGSGDLVIPLVFSVSILGESINAIAFPLVFVPSIAVLAASFAGLLLTIDFVSKRIGTAVPALPLQTAFMIIAFAIMKELGF